MDRIIFGDNQFFGINHMSEDKAAEQAMRFKDVASIIRVIDTAYDNGIHAFMFSTHDRVQEICQHFREDPDRYEDLRLYPVLPYAHKYANAVAEKGMVGALVDCLAAKNSTRNVISMVTHGGLSILKHDPYEVMRLLIDAEMKMFRGLDVKVVFLQNIVTDLLLGYGLKEVFVNYADYIRQHYHASPGFITLNMPRVVDFLTECGIKDAVICSAINKAGYLMNPGPDEYAGALQKNGFRHVAMSILASGAISPAEAIEYVAGLDNIQSIVFGASSAAHIRQTREMIEKHWG